MNHLMLNEGSISAEDTGSDIGSADYREIISRLDDMKDSMETLDGTVERCLLTGNLKI